ncbi:hypothetical protein Q4I30_004052 [Leishmania utingensis]|uniref:Uncharacterized protein n=1 Tax=Leishmania utingensis TaxID=653362 RepID=A0AAW3AF45_9TRYP
MTASSVELEQLKRQLVARYEEEINAELDARVAAAAGDESISMLSSTPSYLYQQLLCLRAGRPYGDGVPTNASETVQLLAENQPPPEVMLLQRMRQAQDESLRLLATRTAATIRESAEQDAAAVAAPPVDDAVGAVGAPEEVAIRPFTAEERMTLLSRLAEGSIPSPLAESVASKLAPAGATPHPADDDVVDHDECIAKACGDQGEAENKVENKEAGEASEEAPAEFSA